MSVKILGMLKLKKKFALYPEFALDGIKKAMESAAEDIKEMARKLCAKGDSGELEESIDWVWGEAPRGSMTLASVRGKEVAGNLTITVFAGNNEAFYARWIEFGTSAHSTAPGGGTKLGKIKASLGGGISHPGSAAQPFFYVSYRANRKRAKSKIKSAVTRAGRKAASI